MPSEVARLRLSARAWRLCATLAVVAGLFWASAYGTDDDFPLGPMSQFAFMVPNDGGQIHSQWLEADRADGKHVRVPMDAQNGGLKRAEVEGQIGRFVHDPALLQGIADGERRLHPGESPYTVIYLVKQTQTLHNGKVASAQKETIATWRVR
jgi:hypothetical protein